MSESVEIEGLLERAAEGDADAVDELLSHYRKRIKRMVRLRLSRRLHGRVDDSDIVQDACLEAAKRLGDYLRNRPLPFFLWLRQLTGEKIIDAHRRHLGAQMRDAALEISLHRGALSAASSTWLAAQLLGRVTSPSVAAAKAETRIRVHEVLNGMDLLDREILALRHFEQLKNIEVAQTLEISESCASSRYLRALKRLREEFRNVPGLFGP